MVVWLWNVNCCVVNILVIVKNECEILFECELYVNNVEYGDLCFGMKKYFMVK